VPSTHLEDNGSVPGSGNPAVLAGDCCGRVKKGVIIDGYERGFAISDGSRGKSGNCPCMLLLEGQSMVLNHWADVGRNAGVFKFATGPRAFQTRCPCFGNDELLTRLFPGQNPGRYLDGGRHQNA
jgi:hypothetical protein